ncbi:MAG TPA: DNA glycosylase [Nitrososphaera sp.]|nr:DNA glycosylase [Nitrososphaera sp.]
MQAEEFDTSEFDPFRSISSGQAFLWEQVGRDWYGIDGDHVLCITPGEENPEFSSSSPVSNWQHDYFRLDDNLREIRGTFSSDEMILRLFSKHSGLRILRQNPEQCLFSFICASNTNIPMIRTMLSRLTRKFGRKVDFGGRVFSTFPSSGALASATLSELRSCGLGYRSTAIKDAASRIANGELDLGLLKKLTYNDAKQHLMQVRGIGNKIADCVLLFSLEKLESFPIDVWIARALARHYQWLHGCKISEKVTHHQYSEIARKMQEHFGRYAGYAQQYIFYDIRQSEGRRW